jgi:hypothetical protein
MSLLSDDPEDDHNLDGVDLFVAAVVTLIALLILFWPGTGRAWGNDIPKHKAIACIIGEAEDQGPEGMRAIAHALRNRRTTLGVYGCTSKRVKNRLYSSKTLVQAIKAWEESRPGAATAAIDPTNGANHWLSYDDRVQGNSWVDWCELRAIVGDHYFYKCD